MAPCNSDRLIGLIVEPRRIAAKQKPGTALPPPIGLGLAPIDAGEVPLDAPLPDAPQISVKASPVEESLSPDEQNELLEELK